MHENKERTERWLQALGLQLPSAVIKFGSIGSMPNSDAEVNGESVRKLSDRDYSGTLLSKEQADYFRNSKVRDEHGESSGYVPWHAER